MPKPYLLEQNYESGELIIQAWWIDAFYELENMFSEICDMMVKKSYPFDIKIHAHPQDDESWPMDYNEEFEAYEISFEDLCYYCDDDESKMKVIRHKYQSIMDFLKTAS